MLVLMNILHKDWTCGQLAWKWAINLLRQSLDVSHREGDSDLHKESNKRTFKVLRWKENQSNKIGHRTTKGCINTSTSTRHSDTQCAECRHKDMTVVTFIFLIMLREKKKLHFQLILEVPRRVQCIITKRFTLRIYFSNILKNGRDGIYTQNIISLRIGHVARNLCRWTLTSILIHWNMYSYGEKATELYSRTQIYIVKGLSVSMNGNDSARTVPLCYHSSRVTIIFIW